MRSGIITQNLGMTRIFADVGHHIPVTVLLCKGCQVIAHRTKDRDGYSALQLGIGAAKVRNLSRALRGHFSKSHVEPRRKIAEFRISSDNFIEIGAELIADHFIEGQYVDAVGISIGKGFAGVMKRHNFGGLCASHGVSVSHRSHGSTGGCQDPGKVFKNKKMAGHMGSERVSVQNLQIVRTDVDRGLIMVRGSVPGAKNGWIYLSDAVKKPVPSSAPRPGAFRLRPSSEPVDGVVISDNAVIGEGV